MPNVYVSYGGGTFEEGSVLTVFGSGNTIVHSRRRIIPENSYEGSGYYQVYNFYSGGPDFDEINSKLPFYYALLRQGRPGQIPAIYPLADCVVGSTYRITIKIKIPNGNPLVSDNCWLTINNNEINSDNADKFNEKVDIGNGVYQAYGNQEGNPTRYEYIRASDLKGVWKELSYDWVETPDTVHTASLKMYVTQFEDGTLIENGEIYIDNIVVEEIPQIVICDLAFEDPAYSKTDETEANANDGQIIIHATSSEAIEYSLNNIDWQESNVFNGLAPATYTLYIRDGNSCTNSLTNVLIEAADAEEPVLLPTSLTQNMGGILATLTLMRYADVAEIPELVEGAVYGNVTLLEGKSPQVWSVILEKGSSIREGRNSIDGNYKGNRLKFFIPKDRSVVAHALDVAEEDEYIVIYRDSNGLVKIFGSTDRPVRFVYSHDTGTAFADLNAFEGTFYYDGPNNLFDYYGTIPNPPQGPAPALVKVNGEVIASLQPGEVIEFETNFDFTYQIIGT